MLEKQLTYYSKKIEHYTKRDFIDNYDDIKLLLEICKKNNIFNDDMLDIIINIYVKFNIDDLQNIKYAITQTSLSNQKFRINRYLLISKIYDNTKDDTLINIFIDSNIIDSMIYDLREFISTKPYDYEIFLSIIMSINYVATNIKILKHIWNEYLPNVLFDIFSALQPNDIYTLFELISIFHKISVFFKYDEIIDICNNILKEEERTLDNLDQYLIYNEIKEMAKHIIDTNLSMCKSIK